MFSFICSLKKRRALFSCFVFCLLGGNVLNRMEQQCSLTGVQEFISPDTTINQQTKWNFSASHTQHLGWMDKLALFYGWKFWAIWLYSSSAERLFGEETRRIAREDMGYPRGTHIWFVQFELFCPLPQTAMCTGWVENNDDLINPSNIANFLWENRAVGILCQLVSFSTISNANWTFDWESMFCITCPTFLCLHRFGKPQNQICFFKKQKPTL